MGKRRVRSDGRFCYVCGTGEVRRVHKDSRNFECVECSWLFCEEEVSELPTVKKAKIVRPQLLKKTVRQGKKSWQ